MESKSVILNRVFIELRHIVAARNRFKKASEIANLRIQELEAGLAAEKRKVQHLEGKLSERNEEIKTRAEEARHLRTVLDVTREDSALLDAVRLNKWTILYRSMHSRWELLTDHAHPAHRKTYTGKTLRAAIEAARKGEKDVQG